MRALKHLVVASALVFSAACSSDDAIGPDRQTTTPPIGIQPTSDAAVDDLTNRLKCLYTANPTNEQLPNFNATTGKLDEMIAALEDGNYALAYKKYQDLLRFLQNWKAKMSATLLTTELDLTGCSDAFTDGILVGGAFDLVIGDLNALWAARGGSQLTGQFCEVAPNNTTVCEGQEEDASNLTGPKSKVVFPPSAQLTWVYVENLPPGLQRLQTLTNLDEYAGTYVRIQTEPATGFGTATVVVCFNFADPEILLLDESVLKRLLLGKRHTSPTGPVFSLLDALENTAEIENYCDVPPGYVFAPFPNTGVGQLANRFFNWLVPSPLQAGTLSAFGSAFGGVGGSAEEFSEFGAVDPGMSAFGGAGGSAEEFAPGIMPSAGGPEAAARSTDGGTTFQGDIDEQYTPANISGVITGPYVQLETPAGNPLDDVTVKWELVETDQAVYSPSPSGATFCGGSVTETAVTANGGIALAPCIDFGPTPGYMKLRATFKSDDVSPNACILLRQPDNTQTEVCAADGIDGYSSQHVNFLIQTYEPPASWACELGKASKLNFGAFDGTASWYSYFQVPALETDAAPVQGARIRQITLYMSVTGRSSTYSNFPVEIWAYQGATSTTPIAHGTQVIDYSTLTVDNGNLQLPGDNGSPSKVTFLLDGASAVNLGSGPVTIKLKVTSGSTRTPQLWYTSGRYTEATDCYHAVGYSDGVNPTATTPTARQTYRGLGVTVNNTVWE